MKRTMTVVLLVLCGVVAVATSLATRQGADARALSPASVPDPQYLADGNPQPPLPPWQASWLVADGDPQPPLPPWQSRWLIADGNPQPPLPPCPPGRTLALEAQGGNGTV